MNEVVVVETGTEERDRRRVNGLEDVVASFSNPYQTSEPIAQPWTFIRGESYTPITLNRIALSYGYMTYGLVQAVVDVPVEDAFRGGIEIESKELDEEDVDELLRAMEENGDLKAIKDTIKWARLFGGAGLIAATDQDPATPLRELTKGAELKFVDADRWELMLVFLSISGQPYSIDPRRPNLIEAPYNYYGVNIDPSRVTKMLGKAAPSFVRQRLQGWGMSELERCLREINSYIKFQSVLFELVDEAKVDVYGIQAFNDNLATAQGSSLIQLRIQLSNWLKNYKNALVMDKEDTYEQKQIAFSGLADIFEEFRINLCAALKIPYNKLFGQSATGFASGEDSLENYNGMIDADVREAAKPLVREAVKLRCQATLGYTPEDLRIAFKPLRVLSELEEEEGNTAKQTRALELYDRDLLSGQETMESLHKDGLLNVDSEVLDGTREPISPLEMQQEAQETAGAQGDAKLKIEAKKASKPAGRVNGIERLREMLRGERRNRRAR